MTFHGVRSLSIAVLLALGCSPLPEVAYETERVQLAPDFDAPVCRGTLDDLDTQVGRIEEELDRIYDERPIRVYWLEGDLEAHCGEGRAGCYFPSTRVLFAEAGSIDHELVHAVLDSEGVSYFLEEGLAELLSGVGVVYRPDPSGPGPAARLRLSPSEYRKGGLNYAAAAHFMHFVYDEAGAGAVRRLGREIETDASPGRLESVIEEVMHAPVGEVESLYQTSAPRYYPGLAQSRIPALNVDDLARGIDVELDCDAPETRGPVPHEDGGMYRVFRLQIPFSGQVDFDLSGDEEGWLDVLDPYARLHRGWVADWTRPDRTLDPGASHVTAGSRARVDIEGGTYLLVFGTAETDSVRMRLSVNLSPRGTP